jgi:hypothetical protein
MSVADVVFGGFFDDVLAEWGQPFSSAQWGLTEAIEVVFRQRLTFPASWPTQRCEAFIASHADRIAGQLGSVFDDLIDTVTAEYGAAYGVMPHHEDAGVLIDTARREALIEALTDSVVIELPDQIAQSTREDPGRGDGSMTACGPASRRLRWRRRN